MNPSDFRRHAHELVDWMADYLEGGVRDWPVRAQTAPGDVDGQLPDAPPEEGEDMAAIFEDFKRIVPAGMTHWQHPRFMAFFPANSSPPSVLAEMLTATLGANCLMWETSPAATEMETRMMDWLRRMIGLPDGFSGVIQDSASTATLCAVLTARERALDWAGNREGLAGQPKLAFYTSKEAHSSVEKAIRIAGIGGDMLRAIPTDDDFAMDPAALAEAMRTDRAAGIVPAGVVATIGTTGVGAIDPVRAIADVCGEHGAYLHVDAAWAGSALILPEQRHIADGVERADSFLFNPHKWLMTNFDCSAHFVRDPESLVRTLSILPEYLKTKHGAQVTDYRDWSVPLGRRFRALKLWFVIRAYGVDGLRRIVRDHIAWTADLAERIAAEPDFEIVAGPNLALVNFRYRPDGMADGADLDGLNERLLAAVNDGGELYLTRNIVGRRFAIRICVGQTQTTRDDVAAAWDLVVRTARSI